MKRIACFLLTIIATITLMAPYTCYADTNNSNQVIRVCYYPLENSSGKIEEHPYHGYYFDYLQEISQYTGWTYEFVDATYEEAITMLSQDEVDLICGIDKTDQRLEQLDYSNAPVITAKYKLFTTADNHNLYYNDYEYFNGLNIGVLSGCGQIPALDTFCTSHGITVSKTYFDTADAMEAALTSGEVDAIYAINVSDHSQFKIITHFSTTQLYFATLKGDALIADIIAAQKNISNLFTYFEYDLFHENVEVEQDFLPFFTREELAYIEEHPVVYYGADPNWAPIEYTDLETGELRGITSDVLKLLEEYTGLTFEYKASDTFTEALDKLTYGEVEMLTALSHDYEWAAENNVNLSTSYLDSYIVMIYNTNQNTAKDSVALPRNFNITEIIVEGGSFENIIYYDTTEECIEAVANGTAYCTYTNNYIASYHLSNLAYRNLNATKITSINENLSIAVSKDADLRLLSIIDKGLHCISTEKIDAIILEHTLYENELTLRTLLYAYPEFVLVILVSIFTVILIGLIVALLFHLHKTRAIEAVSQTDALTGILNRGAVQTQITMALEKEKQNPTLVCPLIAVDLDNFKAINDNYGHMEGDRLLKAVANVLKNSVRQTDIVGRLGGDEFIVYLTNVNNKKTAEKVAAKLCAAVSALSLEKEEWSEITGSFGVAYGGQDITWDILYRHADSALYVAKEKGKNQYSIFKDV